MPEGSVCILLPLGRARLGARQPSICVIVLKYVLQAVNSHKAAPLAPTIGFLAHGNRQGEAILSVPGKTTVTSYNVQAVFNYGDAFNATTGIFRAPVKGMYQFSASFGLLEAAGALHIDCPTGTWTGIQNAAFFQALSVGPKLSGHFGTSMTTLMEKGDTAFVSLQLYSSPLSPDGSFGVPSGSVTFTDLDHFSGSLISQILD